MIIVLIHQQQLYLIEPIYQNLADTNNNNVSTEQCIMPPCPPGEMYIQVCPETELQ